MIWPIFISWITIGIGKIEGSSNEVLLDVVVDSVGKMFEEGIVTKSTPVNLILDQSLEFKQHFKWIKELQSTYVSTLYFDFGRTNLDQSKQKLQRVLEAQRKTWSGDINVMLTDCTLILDFIDNLKSKFFTGTGKEYVKTLRLNFSMDIFFQIWE